MRAEHELYEETGIDLRNQLSRINPVPIQTEDTDLLENEYKNRLFFVVHVTDRDFLSDGVAPEGSRGSHLKVCNCNGNCCHYIALQGSLAKTFSGTLGICI